MVREKTTPPKKNENNPPFLICQPSLFFFPAVWTGRVGNGGREINTSGPGRGTTCLFFFFFFLSRGILFSLRRALFSTFFFFRSQPAPKKTAGVEAQRVHRSLRFNL